MPSRVAGALLKNWRANCVTFDGGPLDDSVLAQMFGRVKSLSIDRSSSDHSIRDFISKLESSPSKSKVARQLNLKAVRRSFETGAGRLIIDYKEIAVRFVDIAQTNVDGRKPRGGI